MNSTAVIHLSKIDHNLKAIDDRLKPGVKKMSVIKDNAYGHGMAEVAVHIQHKTEWFCVARAEEGKKLRELGIRNPILVFEAPMESTASVYKDFNLTATVNEPASLDILKEGTEYHINFDTGMHRLGVLPEELSDLKEKMNAAPGLKCTGIYTHFFKADDPGNKEVAQQLGLFESIRSEFPSELMTHTANTGGIFHYRDLDLQFDAVRPGVCLYGFGAGDIEVPELEPVMDLKSHLMQVKHIPKGDPVSYGARWKAPEDGYIGVVPIGYSDGIPRVLSSNIEVEIEGKLYPQAGTISMDYSLVYLGKDQLTKGTEVYFLKGKELSAMTWARKAGTIPYEITTNIKEKVSRVFLRT